MPMTLKAFLKFIEENGHSATINKKGHYKIADENGQFLSAFAVSHGKNTKGSEIKDCYIRNYKKAIELSGN